MSARALPVALLALLLVSAACQPAAESSPTATPTATAAAADTPSAEATESAGSETVDIDDIAVDDCYSPPAPDDTVEVVDCAQPHVYQAFALVEYPDGPDDPFPGDQVLDDFALEECRDRFDAYVGMAYADSIYFLHAFKPSEGTWSGGDREVICNLRLEDNGEWTGSGEGSEE